MGSSKSVSSSPLRGKRRVQFGTILLRSGLLIGSILGNFSMLAFATAQESGDSVVASTQQNVTTQQDGIINDTATSINSVASVTNASNNGTGYNTTLGVAAPIPAGHSSMLANEVTNVTNAAIAAPLCYSSLRDLNAAMRRKNAYVVEVYVLCPDTVFFVGANRGVEGFDLGDEPIRPRSNSIVQCGASGSSRNNCTILGGDAQLQLFWSEHPEPDRENVLLEGVTFESVKPRRVAVALVAPGYVEFRDCIFKVRFSMLIPSPLIMVRFDSWPNRNMKTHKWLEYITLQHRRIKCWK